MGTKANPSAFDCYEAADPDEPIFTLLARDAAAPETVLYWASLRADRVRAHADESTGAEVLAELDQIAEARRCAHDMELYRAARQAVDLNPPGFPPPRFVQCDATNEKGWRCSKQRDHGEFLGADHAYEEPF